MNELDLFIAANSIADPAERAAYLERVCADQPELRQRLEALLAGNAQSRHPLDQPPSHPQGSVDDATLTHGDPATTGTFRPAPSAEEAEGTIIAGRYKLRQQIGEGGMGTVWMADQTEPVKRKVAVKLIRVERGQSKTILARFEAERQAIALMDHPHIAKLLDAGTTDTGSPFFVMELVKGIPLSDYCDQHRLTIGERLNLFTQICSAVQHAHQKGIIHRDLKPSNILVESHDGKPVPKVIDFGLAKATTGLQLSEQSMFTAFGAVMGTPLYMAPEQANFNAIDVDTRADVYALGVVLYELLTGTTPLTKETMKKAALDEMLRLIREQEAPTPSSRLSVASSKPSVAANRQLEPAKLGRCVKGELDWIVLKALSKDRDRRYETANSFARDIERFLNHEPVQAGPPTASYRIQKFVRRNRGQVIAAGLVLFALLAGIAGTTLGLIRANHAIEAERMAQAEALHQAENAILASEKERKARLDAQQKQKLAVAAAEAESVAKLDADAKRQEAERNLAFARKGNEILGSMFAGLDPKAQYSTVSELRGALKNNLAKAVKDLDSTAIGNPSELAAMQNTLGSSLWALGEADMAIDVFSKALAISNERLGVDHSETLQCMNNLAACYLALGKWEKALQLMEETFILTTSKLGWDHHNSLIALGNLAEAYHSVGKLDRAILLMEKKMKITNDKFGSDHPETLASMHNLALGYRAIGQLDKAVPLMETTLRLSTDKLGVDHPDTLAAMQSLALGYKSQGRIGQALPLFEKSHNLTIDKLGFDHPNAITSMYNLAHCYRSAGKDDLAMQSFEMAAKGIEKRRFQTENAKLIISSIIRTYEQSRQYNKAEEWQRKWLSAVKSSVGSESSAYAVEVAALGSLLVKQQKWTEAEPLLIKSVESLKTTNEKDSGRQAARVAREQRLTEALDRLIELYTATDRPDEAKKWQAERAMYPTTNEVAPPPREKK